MEVDHIDHSERTPSMLRFATFLSPVLYETYAYISSYVGEQVGCTAQLALGQSLDEFADGRAHIGFLCGLPYSQAAQQDDPAIELLAAPVLYLQRYQGKPVYFSDIVVRAGSSFTSFEDLQGGVWGYNEETSHSGWNIIRYTLAMCGKTLDYFGRLVKTGSHLRSIEMVLQDEIDAAAIDSHVLDVLRMRDTRLDTKLRIIDSFGPSPIPPIVVAKSLPTPLKQEFKRILLALHHDVDAAEALRQGLIARFVPVTDEDYRPVHEMFVRTAE
jgi:phosphonate transport system substrate-binding protein